MVTFNKFLTIGLYIFIALVNGFSSQELYSGASCTLLNGSPGICKSALTCNWLKEEISSRRITFRDLPKLRCGFEGNDEITCCGDGAPTPSPLRKSETACEKYRLERQPSITYHILNGNLSALGEFPHMAALGYLSEEDNVQIDFRCGGSLISDRYILTAAHCSARVQPVVARLGSLNIKHPELDPINYGDVLDVSIVAVILHPDYLSFKNYHDIALVQLTEVVKFNGNLHPACLNTDLSDMLPTTELIITGWGKVDANSDARSDFLLKTNLTVVNLNECNNSLSKFFGRKLPEGLNTGHFCAHDPKGISDACQGDSGGPIQIIDNVSDDRSMPVIIGVTSFGIACGTKLPSIYARVAFYLDWIESIVWAN